MKNKKLPVIIFIAAAFFIGAVIYLMPNRQSGRIIQTTALIEATEVNISPKITERISDIKFREGDSVNKGDTIITLDDSRRSAEYQQAEANLEAVKANLSNILADIDKAKIRIEEAKRDLGRMNTLLEKGLIPQNDKDKAQTSYDLAVADLNKAQAQEISALAGIKQSEAALNIAKSNLEDTVIVSPISGIVTLRAFEPGEMASQGATVLTIIDTQDIWARADVEEGAVARIKLGDKVILKIDSLPREKFEGRVSEINSEGEFATQRDAKRGKQDIRTFRVKVKIENPQGVLKTGMTTTAVFSLN